MNNLIDLEDEEFDEKSVSIKDSKQTQISRLKEKDLLRYGSLISEMDIEFVTGMKKSSMDLNKWGWVVCHFRELVKGEGFYITSRGKNDNFYILLPHEMASYNEQKNRTAFGNLKQRQRALHMIDDSILSDDAKKKLEFEILRNASLEIEMASKMKERCRY
jgi:hypothetical protein